VGLAIFQYWLYKLRREREVAKGKAKAPIPDVRLVLYLALSKMEKKWERSIRNWSAVLGQFSVFFKDRIPA
jgi:transposase-like protein